MFQFIRKMKAKCAPIDLNHPDAIVIVTNTRSSQNPFGKNYRGCCAIKEDDYTSACFQTMDGNDMLYEQPHRCSVNFLIPEAYPYTLWVGRKIELYEGRLLVGTMEIESINNSQLDRDRKFKNQDEILSDRRVLNIALKRSLEWGRKLNEPLDNKLMKSIPALSGADIEKVSDYVTQVRDEVIWKIYYSNWDVKKQELTVDAESIVAEKYPWIDRDNRRSLHSQGQYYAWHG